MIKNYYYGVKAIIVVLLGLLIPHAAISATATWTKIGPTITGATFTSLAVNPINQNIMYAGTKATTVGATSGLYKTTDGGATWSLTSLQQDIGLVVIDPATPTIIFASPFVISSGTLTGGLFKSSDSGANWVNVDIINTTMGGAMPVRALIFSSNILYALTSDATAPSRVYSSVNKGVTWSPIFSGVRAPTFLAINPANSANMLLVTSFDGIFKSTDGGLTNAPTNTGLPVGLLFYNWIKYDPFNPNVVYANNGGTYKSIDNGITWVSFTSWPNNNSLKFLSNIYFDPSTAGTIFSLSFGYNYLITDPFTGGISGNTFSSGTSSIYKSVDGGTTWIPSADGTTAGGIIGTVSNLILRSGNMYVVGSQGVFKESTAFSELQVAIKNNPGPINTGAPVSYIIKAMNNGPDNATGVVVTDTLPANTVLTAATSTKGACTSSAAIVTCNVGNLAAGSSATINVSLIASVGGNITNTVAITAMQPDPYLPNNNANTVTQITGPPPPPVPAPPLPPVPAPSGGGGGGCVISTQSGFDPVLPLLALIAGAWLMVRRRKMNY